MARSSRHERADGRCAWPSVYGAVGWRDRGCSVVGDSTQRRCRWVGHETRLPRAGPVSCALVRAACANRQVAVGVLHAGTRQAAGASLGDERLGIVVGYANPAAPAFSTAIAALTAAFAEAELGKWPVSRAQPSVRSFRRWMCPLYVPGRAG